VLYLEQTAPGQVAVESRARVLLATVTIGEGASASQLAIAATTLAWQSSQNRADALDYVFSVLAPYDDVVLMGDFNFDEGAQPETSHINSDYVDAWRAVEPSKDGYTWDPTTNEFAHSADPESRPSRIDRIFVKSSRWLPRYIKRVACSSSDLLCAGDTYTTPTPAGPVTSSSKTVTVSQTTTADLPKEKQVITKNWVAPIAQSSIKQSTATTVSNTKSADGSSFLSLYEQLSDDDVTPIEADVKGEEGAAPQPAAAAVPDTGRLDDSNGAWQRYPSTHYGLWLHASRFASYC